VQYETFHDLVHSPVVFRRIREAGGERIDPTAAGLELLDHANRRRAEGECVSHHGRIALAGMGRERFAV
jgi:hypothetical protein